MKLNITTHYRASVYAIMFLIHLFVLDKNVTFKTTFIYIFLMILDCKLLKT